MNEVEKKLKEGEPVSKLTGELRERVAKEFFCSGVSSRAGEREHVLFMDLDGKSLDKTIKLTVELIHKYMLSDCYVIRSSFGNYHIICLDKFDFEDVYDILRKYSHGQWVRFRAESEDFVLRLSIKGMKPAPRLMCVVESPYTNQGLRRKSNAHRILMNKRYGAKIRRDFYFDETTRLKIHIYRTRMVRK